MDYIDKLFSQHPFIYYIDGEYYAFGVNTCTKCDGKSVLLESRYKNFEESIKNDVTDEEAWRIFHKLWCEASGAQKRGFAKTKEEFAKFNFDGKNMEELNKQIDRYIDYWQEHHLKDVSKLK